ncbi:MAG: DUF1254 domain-containing protein [Actinomycetota bacterium]|nr:DUF1254 domain-containing protein [Actinomycetota bacterium]
MADEQLVQAATRSYVYGYPVLYNLDEIDKVVTGRGTMFDHPVSWNTFAPVRSLVDHTTEFVSPNNDTLYLIAPLDLSGGPVRLDVPDTADRYYVLQCIDAWTNNFAYIGRRGTGTAAGSFTFVPPGFRGSVDDGSTVVHSPTTIAIIVGRIQVDGVDDLAAVHALQDQFSLSVVDPSAPLAGMPAPVAGVADGLAWWERLRVALAEFPPPAGDAPFVATLDTLGLTAAESPFVDPDPTVADALRAGGKAGADTIEQLARGGGTGGGWLSAKHYFDYNLDYFEVGTLDAPEWKIEDRSKAAVNRAVAARAGLWGNHGYEACYDLIFADSDGEPLDGAGCYTVTFSPAPPADAFWSLTMYDVPRFYLVDNPIDRYSLGDRSPGLVTGPDGSVTIHLQATSPGADRESNWLPTPSSGNFRPILRTYQPGQAILTDTYPMPEIIRTDR